MSSKNTLKGHRTVEMIIKTFAKAGLLAGFAAACAGPAGVAPMRAGHAVSRACVIDSRALQGLSQLTVNAESCPQLTIVGEPIVIAGDQHLIITHASQILVNGSLIVDGQFSFAGLEAKTPFKLTQPTDLMRVHGTLQLAGTQISGAGSVFLGSEEAAPQSIYLSNSEVLSDEHDAAPALTLFGGTSGDCSNTHLEQSFVFDNVVIRETAGHRLEFFNTPSSIDGLMFAPAAAPFTVDLGNVCIPKDQAFTLNSRGAVFQAGDITVAGSLSINNSSLTVRGEQGIVVDGGILNSVATDDKPNQIVFSDDSPAPQGQTQGKAQQRIQGKNKANVTLKKTEVKKGSVVVTNSSLSVVDSTIEGNCFTFNGNQQLCDSAEENAAIIAIGDSSVDIENSKLLPDSKSQVVAKPAGDQKPRITSSGDDTTFTASTDDGDLYPVHLQRVVEPDIQITSESFGKLIALNGTYTGPCITQKDSEGKLVEMSIRRTYSFENTFQTIRGRPTKHKSLSQTVTRTVTNYRGQDCNTPINTSVSNGDAYYFVLVNVNVATGEESETLTNKMFVSFKQTLWTYHDQILLNVMNSAPGGLCEMNDWAVDVAKDVTTKKCFGTVMPMTKYYDRFKIIDAGNLHLALDIDDRPEDLQDLIPGDINQISTYIRQ